MANIKVTPLNIKQKLTAWSSVVDPTLADQLVYLPSEGIDPNEIIILGWKNNIVIEVQSYVGSFMKFVYKEKLA
jgi:hypothetical protein